MDYSWASWTILRTYVNYLKRGARQLDTRQGKHRVMKLSGIKIKDHHSKQFRIRTSHHDYDALMNVPYKFTLGIFQQCKVELCITFESY